MDILKIIIIICTFKLIFLCKTILVEAMYNIMMILYVSVNHGVGWNWSFDLKIMQGTSISMNSVLSLRVGFGFLAP